MNLLSFVPSWAPWAAAGGLAIVAGIATVGMHRAETRAADERAAHAHQLQTIADQHAKALQSEIEAHNATQTKVEAIHADAERSRILARSEAASAASALDRAGRAERRLRDAAATAAVIAGAAHQAGATAGQCQAAAEAAGVLAGVLDRIDAAAGRIGAAALGISRHADEAYAASVECAAISDAGR